VKPSTLVLIASITALAACKPVTSEEAAASCEMSAEKALASSPLVGWDREKAKGSFANTCMRVSGYVRNEAVVRGLCAQGSVKGAPDEFYWRMDADCWTARR
jgi:hypothetical protein